MTQAPLFGSKVVKPSAADRQVDPRIKPLILAAQEAAGYRFLSWGREAAACRRLLAGKWEVPAILDCLRYLLTDPFYKDNAVPVDLVMVSDRIGAWDRAGRPERCKARDGAERHGDMSKASDYYERWAAKAEARRAQQAADGDE